MTDDEYQLIIIFMESVESFYEPFIKLNAGIHLMKKKKRTRTKNGNGKISF